MSWALLMLGAAAGGFVNGMAGFGTAMFALGFWLQFLPPVQAVAISVVVSVVTGLQGILLVRRTIQNDYHRIAMFVLPALPGIPIGTAILSFIEPRFLKLVVAGLMLLYGGFFVIRRRLPQVDRSMPLADVTVGFFGGVLGGAASLSGALPTMWCAMRAWTKSETRAVIQTFNIAVLGMTAAVLAVHGIYTADVLVLLLIALPVAIVSAQAGIATFKRLRDDQFRRIIVSLMFVSGLILVLREII